MHAAGPGARSECVAAAVRWPSEVCAGTRKGNALCRTSTWWCGSHFYFFTSRARREGLFLAVLDESSRYSFALVKKMRRRRRRLARVRKFRNCVHNLLRFLTQPSDKGIFIAAWIALSGPIMQLLCPQWLFHRLCLMVGWVSLAACALNALFCISTKEMCVVKKESLWSLWASEQRVCHCAPDEKNLWWSFDPNLFHSHTLLPLKDDGQRQLIEIRESKKCKLSHQSEWRRRPSHVIKKWRTNHVFLLRIGIFYFLIN